MSDFIEIDGNTYNVPVVSCDISADFLDKFAERTIDGKLHRELIGVYFNYQLKFGSASMADFTLLWDKLTEPVEFHTVTIPEGDSQLTYTAYFAGIKGRLSRVKGSTYFWKDLTVNFIAQEPSRS